MNFTIGHFFYISGLIVVLVAGLSLLFLKNLNIFFEGRYPNPQKARNFWGIFCLVLFLSGTTALVINWSKVTPLGRISFSSQEPHIILLSNAAIQLTDKPVILKPDQPVFRLNRSLSIRVKLKEEWRPEPPWKQIRLPDGTMVTIGAALISADGTKYLPTIIGFAGELDIRFQDTVPKNKKIVQIELTADHPLTALTIAWVDQNLK